MPAVRPTDYAVSNDTILRLRQTAPSAAANPSAMDVLPFRYSQGRLVRKSEESRSTANRVNREDRDELFDDQDGTCSCNCLGGLRLACAGPCPDNLTIGTVNNSDMVRMQGLSSEFEAAHPDIKLDWVTLEENILRQRVTTDIATNGGQFDVMTIGTYEVPIWAKQDWLKPLDGLGDDYDADDLIPAIRNALSVDGTLYAAPFYAESVLTLYRTDLFEKAGLEMPEQPTWDFIAEAAEKITDQDAGVYGLCLRGKPGWGENMGFLGNMAARSARIISMPTGSRNSRAKAGRRPSPSMST